MTGLRRVVVVGNGIAGVTAADTLRALGFAGELVLIGEEEHAAYSRPALSKELLRDDADMESHLLPPPTHGATELRGVRAVGLDPRARELRLEDGQTVAFDGLVLATGCRPRRVGGDGEGAPEELTLRTLDDAWRLRARVGRAPAVVVLGGGPLGMEIASSCLETGCEVTLVSLGAPLEGQLGPHLSGLVVFAARERGLHLVQSGASRLHATADGTVVELGDGSMLRAGLVVSAVGDRPNVEWLADSGLLRDGVLHADAQGRVAPGIVAAGDVATVATPFGPRRIPLWSSAIEQGRQAAASLLGLDADAGQVAPYFWTEQFGISLKAVGHAPFTGTSHLVDGDAEEGRLLLRWEGPQSVGGSAAAVNYRIPIPRLRRVAVGSAA